MNTEIKTMTAKQLAVAIAHLIKNGEIKEDTRIYMSSDEEGNSFGTITKDSFSLEDGVLILFPFQERLDFDDLI